MAAEFGPHGVAVNALWPRTVIATAAINMIPGVRPGMVPQARIVADAAHAVLVRDGRGFTGHFLIDEDVLREAGITDFALRGRARRALLPDLFLD